MRVLVDTNILLDVFQKRLPHQASADQVWALVETKSIKGYVSAISFNNIFYVARKQDGREKALESLAILRSIFGVVALDEQLIDEALSLKASDFEDAIQACVAKRIQADYVVTRNLGDFKSLGVDAVTAAEFLALHHSSHSDSE
jgi:predicted nucleic acid-binding protein